MAKKHPLAAYRERTGKTQEEIARSVGCSKPTISRIESGNQGLSDALLKKLVRKTGVPAALLRPDLAALMQEPAE